MNSSKPPLLVMAIWFSWLFLLEFFFLLVSTCRQAPQSVSSSVILPSSVAALTSLLLFDESIDFDIILAALKFMAGGTLSFTSFMLNDLLREAVLLAATSRIASFTCEPCAIVLCRPLSYLPFSGEASHTYFFRRKVSASRILQVPGSLFPEFFQKLFAVCRASNKNFSWPRGEIIR